MRDIERQEIDKKEYPTHTPSGYRKVTPPHPQVPKMPESKELEAFDKEDVDAVPDFIEIHHATHPSELTFDVVSPHVDPHTGRQVVEIDPYALPVQAPTHLHKIDPYSVAELADKMPRVKQLPGTEDVHILPVVSAEEGHKELDLKIDLPSPEPHHF